MEIRKCVKHTLNLIFALPLVEADDIEVVYLELKEQFLIGAKTTRMDKYFEYFEDEWLVNCPPSEWSVFDATRRTNNAAESRNRTINADFGKHPHAWAFTSK